MRTSEDILKRSSKAAVNQCVLVALAWMLIAMSSLAQAVDPAPVRLGESTLFPEIGLEYLRDDNVFRTSNGESSATGIAIQPRLNWIAEKGVTRLRAQYLGNIAESGISAADYDSHQFLLGLNTEFSRRSRFSTRFEFIRATEQRGTGLTTGSTSTLPNSNISNLTRFRIAHTYGAKNARGNLETGLRITDFNYLNNENLTQNSNFTEFSPYVNFSIRTGALLRTFLELQFSAFDFDVDINDRDEINSFIGVILNESDRLGGTAKIGVINFSFDDSVRSGGNEIGLEIGAYFRPVSYSTFTLVAERSIFNIDDVSANSANDAALSDKFELSWIHSWSSRFSHRAVVDLDVVERNCSSSNDVSTRSEFELILAFRRWLDFGIGARQKVRDFDGCTALVLDESVLQSTKNELFFKINASL